MRCYFHLFNGDETILDETGIEVADVETAKVEAMKAIRELREEIDSNQDEWRGWQLQIVCPESGLLCTLDLDIPLH